MIICILWIGFMGTTIAYKVYVTIRKEEAKIEEIIKKKKKRGKEEEKK